MHSLKPLSYAILNLMEICEQPFFYSYSNLYIPAHFLPRDAMRISAVLAIGRCPSVRPSVYFPSVTLVYYIQTVKDIDHQTFLSAR